MQTLYNTNIEISEYGFSCLDKPIMSSLKNAKCWCIGGYAARKRVILSINDRGIPQSVPTRWCSSSSWDSQRAIPWSYSWLIYVNIHKHGYTLICNHTINWYCMFSSYTNIGDIVYPLVICYIANWKITMLLMGKSTISTGPFSIAILT